MGFLVDLAIGGVTTNYAVTFQKETELEEELQPGFPTNMIQSTFWVLSVFRCSPEEVALPPLPGF